MQHVQTFCDSPPSSESAPAPSWLPSVSRSELDRDELQPELEGELPAWLRGRLMRTAPAGFERGAWRAEHWFDGLGMLYSFELGASPPRFQQRALDSQVAAQAARGRVEVASFASPNQRSFLRRLFQPIPEVTDNANVNVVHFGEEWLALTESPHQLRVDERDLTVRGRVRYDDELPARLGMLAHPQFDFERGLLVNLGVALGKAAEIVAFSQAPGSASRREIARLSLPELPYLHSFGLTRDSLVVVAHPFETRPASLLWSNRGFIEHFAWRPERGTQLYVLDRAGGATRRFETEPLFTFHTVNTFADGPDLVLDLLAYADPGIVSEFRVENMMHALTTTRPLLRRIRLRADGSTQDETLCSTGFEFPAVNYRANAGKRQRFVWGSTALNDGADVIKVDLETGATRRHGEPGYRFGEPVFVARPGGRAEDEGVVLVTGSSSQKAVLAVLDAQTLDRLASVRVPVPLPLGFHGSFARS